MNRISVKSLLIAAAATGGFVAVAATAGAQYTPGYSTYSPYSPPVYAPQPAPQVAGYYYALTPAQIDQLLAPIALYPDPLLADILPASTYPEQLNQVAISLRANPNIDDNYINAQPWPDAVKVLAHYPDIITFMTARPDWTTAMGSAFAEQPGDVMDSIQRLRAEAQAAGSLYSTPQQQVIVNGGYIQIVPAQAGVVYVPAYDPQVVYVRGRAPRDALRFDSSFRVGPWLNFDFDWGHHDVGIGARWDRGRPDHGSDFRPWTRDAHLPPPRLPAPVVNRYNNDVRRGYVPTPPHPVFDTRDNRTDVQRAIQRAQQSRPSAVPHPTPGSYGNGRGNPPGGRGGPAVDNRGNTPGNDGRGYGDRGGDPGDNRFNR